MELHAINTAVSWITESGLKKAIILSDCQSALASISNPHRSRHFIVNEIISNINRLKTNKISVSLAWIPGHAGIKGNEKADSLAKRAAQRRPEQNTVALSTDEVKKYLYNVCKCEWNEVYQECEKGQQYKALRPTIHTKLPQLPSRRYDTIIFRLRTGHCRLNQHLNRIGCASSPLCHRCGTPESVEHYIINCPLYDHQREPLKNVTNQLQLPFTIPNLLTHPIIIPYVAEYVVSTGKPI